MAADDPGLRRARILYWMGTLSLPFCLGLGLGSWSERRALAAPSGLLIGAVAVLGAGLLAMSVALAREQALNGPSPAKRRVRALYAAALVLAVAGLILRLAARP